MLSHPDTLSWNLGVGALWGGDIVEEFLALFHLVPQSEEESSRR